MCIRDRRGGGVALGPKPRSYAQRTPKKMIRLALYSALSDRAADEKVLVVDGWSFDAPSTKAAVAALEAIDVAGKVLLVLGENDEVAWRSFRNLGHVHCLFARELNAYDVLVSDYVVFTRDTLPSAKPTGKDDKRHGSVADTRAAGTLAAEEGSAS